ncbi:Hypothetical protein NTJ_01406 [Nesidiocoris tenuis]|uniref:Uncharacterized protein n=1 Tax=Nesidiocoris tenuis TaxID=355587 RepID=A0ABN7A8G8_9HEMI|nr:Hypothetical protein NTJ_01406 [Nesidiocoris tenuis]
MREWKMGNRIGANAKARWTIGERKGRKIECVANEEQMTQRSQNWLLGSTSEEDKKEAQCAENTMRE